jgi:TonB family protein
MMPVIALLALVEAVSVVGPVYPPNAVAGGNVVAVVHLASGAVRDMDILIGDPPFVDPVKAALKGWRFNGSGNENVLIVVNFRTPALHPIGSPMKELNPVRTGPGLPFPKAVAETAYPPNSLAEGSIILKLTVNEFGSVSKAKVLQSLGNLSEACLSAINRWQFLPAKNAKGLAVPAEAYAVFVVRRPVLGP